MPEPGVNRIKFGRKVERTTLTKTILLGQVTWVIKFSMMKNQLLNGTVDIEISVK